MANVNYLAVFVAAVAVFILGWLWYSPLLFFKPWMRLRGMDPDAAMKDAKMPGLKLVLELIRCFVLAYVIAHLVTAVGISGWMSAVHFALLTWIGFPVVLLTGSVIWDERPRGLAVSHAGDWLVKMVVISLIVTLWR